MASSIEFVEFIGGRIRGIGDIHYRRMFGEYALYRGNKVIGLICDNCFFLKRTEEGREMLGGNAVEGPAYKGSGLFFIIDGDWDDSFLTDLVRATADALPEPKPRRRKKDK